MVLQKMWDQIWQRGVWLKWTWQFWGVKPLKPEIQETMLLEREWFTDKSTIGSLSFDGIHTCFTLEDTCRRLKVPSQTAIPSGRYEVTIDYSQRFNKLMPHILGVPQFDGIRIHSGNTAGDTDGCILVGLRKDTDAIYDSRKAFDIVMSELERRLAKGKVYLSVVGGISKEQFNV